MKDAWFGEATASYRDAVLADLESKAEQEMVAWHADNAIQSFFAGRYLGDDLALVRSITDRARSTGGMPTMG